MTDGYIYCFSNPAMPYLVKIGMTKYTPEVRLSQANKPYTWIPQSFKIEFAKKVSNPRQKEKTLHRLLKQDRPEPRKEFFRVSPEKVRMFFDLIDGEMWTDREISPEGEMLTGKRRKREDKEEEEEEEEEEEDDDDEDEEEDEDDEEEDDGKDEDYEVEDDEEDQSP